MKSSEIEFKIDQLRKDQILSAVESCAITLACGLLIWVGRLLGPSDSLGLVVYQLVLVGFVAGYLVLTWKRNFGRTKKIGELEEKLES